MQNGSLIWKHCAAIIAILSLLAVGIGCGGRPQVPVVNAATQDPVPPAPGTTVTVSPTELSFEPSGANAAPASNGSQSVTLANTGNKTLKISDISSDSSAFTHTNNCGTTLDAGRACSISVSFVAAAPGTTTGTLSITHDGQGGTRKIKLKGNGGSPVVTLSAVSVSFANQVLSSTSPSQAVTVTNTGNYALLLGSVATTGDFSQTNNCMTSVAAGTSCTISVTFKPTATGTRTGALTITDNASGSPQQVALSGTGVNAPTPAASVTPSSLTFANQVLNSTSAAQTVTLTNTGNAALSISGVAVSGDFAQTNNCGTSVAASANCTISVTFKPTATGTRTGTLTITDNATGSPHQVALSGTVNAPTPVFGISPSSLTFANQVVNTTSAAQGLTLSNSGNAALSISMIAVTGDYAQTNNCNGSVSAGGNCTISVTFTPTAIGTRGGSLTITDNASGSPHQVAFTGSGIAAPAPIASLSPTSLTFTSQTVNTTSATKTVTLTNTGNAALSITGIGISGDFFQVSTCGTSLASGANCKFTVSFTPSTVGTRTGSLTISDNAVGSPHQVTLTGTGAALGQLAVSPTSVAFGNVAIGSSGTQTVQLSNTGGSSLTISSASTSGVGFSVSGLTLPLTLTAGTSATFTATFTPTSTGTASGSIMLTNNGTVSPVTISLGGAGVAPVAHSVQLLWAASASPVVGYNIYRSTQSGGPYTRINSVLNTTTSFVDTTVASGGRYFYVVTAVDTNNLESGYSNETSAVIPTP